jgi:CBS domain-containing protein
MTSSAFNLDQPVSSLMSSDVISVLADDTITTVTEQLLRHGLSFMPVMDRAGGVLLGVIDADDLLQFRQAGRDPDQVQAWQACAFKPVAASPDTPVRDVARQMAERHIHHVIVTSNKNVLGVVSSLDIVRQMVPAGA